MLPHVVGATVAIVAAGLAAAVVLQAATGFGLALLAGPILYAAMQPSRALVLLLAVGLVVNLLVLGAERRRPHVPWRSLAPALLAAAPGLPVGALLLRALPADALRIAIGLIVIALAARRLAHRAAAPGPGAVAGGRAAIAAGFAAGVLTTSTTTNGPPLVLWLARSGLPPAAVRDAVAAVFLVLDAAGLAVVVAATGPSRAVAGWEWVVAALPLVLVAHAVGRRIFERLPAGRFEHVLLVSVLCAGVASLVAGLR